jgi:hypothetical protein
MRWIFFNLPYTFRRTMALESTQPLIEMSTRIAAYRRGKFVAIGMLFIQMALGNFSFLTVFEYILISLTACNFFFITFENL